MMVLAACAASCAPSPRVATNWAAKGRPDSWQFMTQSQVMVVLPQKNRPIRLVLRNQRPKNPTGFKTCWVQESQHLARHRVMFLLISLQNFKVMLGRCSRKLFDASLSSKKNTNHKSLGSGHALVHHFLLNLQFLSLRILSGLHGICHHTAHLQKSDTKTSRSQGSLNLDLNLSKSANVFNQKSRPQTRPFSLLGLGLLDARPRGRHRPRVGHGIGHLVREGAVGRGRGVGRGDHALHLLQRRQLGPEGRLLRHGGRQLRLLLGGLATALKRTSSAVWFTTKEIRKQNHLDI